MIELERVVEWEKLDMILMVIGIFFSSNVNQCHLKLK